MAQRNSPATPSTLSLPSDTEILIERSFRAPRVLVWRAFTDPKLVPKWYGPTANSMTRCEIDLRVGGKFLYAWGEHTMPGEFTVVDPPRRYAYVDTGVTPSTVTCTFTEEKGVTKVTMRANLGTKALRDEMLASGWVEGMEACYGFLDKLLPGLR
ncbi:MAG TPA: SRPBCC domain-containing protein [Candidatus Thermoplasmatota archaeon]|nr:SRPBCC domain-containing protein [Candidatus Thermoplasmatota archaeon]